MTRAAKPAAIGMNSEMSAFARTIGITLEDNPLASFKANSNSHRRVIDVLIRYLCA